MGMYVKDEDVIVFIGGGYIDVDSESFMQAERIDIVFCKECKRQDDCSLGDNGFCSDGERIENGNTSR